MKTIHSMSVALLLAASALTVQAAKAQMPGIGRVDLLKQDLSAPGREVVQVRVDFGPGVSAPAHSHPGEEVAFVLEGTLEYQLNGKTVTLKAGETLFIPAGAVHSAKNTGSGDASELATYIVEKSKPLVVISR
ncbi:cupin domain-containing protein [Pseudoduganella sp. LjRoot289]|uniref:cupin domain-containing protein n=1 Tax=Pseudoduganella sp. LjRoot289 TaxID=3342314 RepID=UPI003ECD9635